MRQSQPESETTHRLLVFKRKWTLSLAHVTLAMQLRTLSNRLRLRLRYTLSSEDVVLGDEIKGVSDVEASLPTICQSRRGNTAHHTQTLSKRRDRGKGWQWIAAEHGCFDHCSERNYGGF
jgi:hypothetical protein